MPRLSLELEVEVNGTADTIRLAGTYAIGILVLVGCFLLLMVPSQVPSEQLLPFVTGVVGLVLGWVFNRESTAGGQRAAERAFDKGATTATNSSS